MQIALFLQPPLVLGATAAAVYGVNALITRFKLERTLPRMAKIYRLLDPMLIEVMGSWSGSQVRFATEIVVALLADSKLSKEEVKWAAQQVQQRYMPERAAGQPLKLLPVGSNERVVINRVIDLVEGGSFHNADALAAARALSSVVQGGSR